MMQSDTNTLALFDGTVYGRVEPWPNDPEIFDGWLEIEGQTDQLVVNGSGRSWAEVEVARQFIMQGLNETPEERKALLHCEPDAWKNREDRLRRIREASEIMGDAIGRHYRSGGKS